MDLRPLHYEIKLTPDLETTSFEGKTVIDIEVFNPVKEIKINALDLEIKSVIMKSNGSSIELKTSYSLEDQELTLMSDEKFNGKFSLGFDFTGIINDKLEGFYQSKYKVDGEERLAAVTQFQESDARRAFPCFDHPALKATFDITLVVSKDLNVISVGSIIESTEVGDKMAYRFEKSPPMSTYLLFFGVGEFDFIESYQDEVSVRVYASPGQAEKYGSFGLDFGKKSLKYCEDYFVIPYPFKKLDLIGTPDFAHGAMENWSAILFRENYLLNYPGVTSKRMETIIQMVIAHEITHQWFGNLTTPATWKYLWLNESFATFFGFGIIDVYYPEKKIWNFFLQTQTGVALGADAYVSTSPIEIEGDGAVGMTVKSAPIIYNKGGSILRMLEAYVSPEKFKAGLRLYLKNHQYDVASSSDLWDAISEASNMAVSSLMESWVLQTGHPLINVERNGNILELEQSRFTFLDNNSDYLWEIPVSIIQFNGINEISTSFIILKDRSTTFLLDESCTSFKLNKDLTGFYRVNYDFDDLNKMGGLILDKHLGEIDRWNLINELYATVRSGDTDLEDYLKFIPHYDNEDNYLAITAISGQLFALFSLFDGDLKERITKIGLKFCESVLERIGYDPKEDEETDITSIRSGIIYNAVVFGSDKAEQFALGIFDKVRAGEKVSADIIGNILSLGAILTNDREFLINGFENAANEQSSLQYLAAIGNFSDLDLIEEMQMYTFDKVPSRNRGTIINRIVNNPIAKKTLWKWYLANLDNFEALHEYMYQSVLVDLIPICIDDMYEIKEFFVEYLKKREFLRDAIDIALEQVEINAQMKNDIKNIV